MARYGQTVMEKVFKERFNGKYHARKTIQTEFARYLYDAEPLTDMGAVMMEEQTHGM